MRSPKDMQIILIDITNACNQRCSNCTRFCGNHKKPFFMDFETFQRAVDSMAGFEGVTGLIGGEPTLHPQFERFTRYIREKLGTRRTTDHMVDPQKNFIKGVRQQEFQSRVLRQRENGSHVFNMYGPCLFSNLGKSYLRYYELIQDSYDVQFLNDHMDPSMHQPGLVARKDLGINDEQWFPIRDNCWLQSAWSATITPKGAFFCEIAAALDMLFHGPGGWPIEPGWWRRTPEEFGEQLNWCEYCGFALKTFMRKSTDQVDDVSPTLYRMLQEVESPGLRNGRTKLLNIAEDGSVSMADAARESRFSDTQPYLEYYENRYSANDDDLKIHSCAFITIPEGAAFGRMLNDALEQADGWVALCQEPARGREELTPLFQEYVFNPGSAHIGKEAILLHKKASALKKLGYDRIARTSSVQEILDFWQTEKIIPLSEIEQRSSRAREALPSGERIAIWGTGLAGGFFLDAIRSSGSTVPFAVNGNRENWGKVFYDIPIAAPQALIDRAGEYDHLLIAHYTLFEEIRDQALVLGVPAEKILLPCDV